MKMSVPTTSTSPVNVHPHGICQTHHHGEYVQRQRQSILIYLFTVLDSFYRFCTLCKLLCFWH
jgi:hypothetical protein